MSDTTNASAQTSAGEGVNTAGTEGAGTSTETPKNGTSTEKKERTFTQAELDTILKGRLADQERTLTSRHETDLATKIAAATDAAKKDVEALVETRVTERMNESALTAKRGELKTQYGLSDAQVERVTGSTPDELAADAEALFGAFAERKPPRLRSGTHATDAAPLDFSKMTPAQIREATATK